jgi:hypothetical protein
VAARIERGAALLVAVMAALVVSVLISALVVTTTSEVLTGSAFEAAQRAQYAAESAAEWTLADIVDPGADWSAIASGATASAFADGPASGVRTLGDGSDIDFGSIAAANPGWHFYAFGELDRLLPDLNTGSRCYIVVLVAPDATSAARMKIRALSYGPRGAAQAFDVNAVRIGPGGALESWRR